MKKIKFEFKDIQTIAQYFRTIQDFKHLELCNSKYRGITHSFTYNPIPLTKKSRQLFSNIFILYLYSPFDCQFLSDAKISHRVNLFEIVSYQKYIKEKEKNYIYKKVKYTCQDIRLYGNIVPEDVRIMTDNFNDQTITELIIPNNILTVHSLCLESSISIKKLSFGSKWELHGDRMFLNGPKLQSIKFPRWIEQVNGNEYNKVVFGEYTIDDIVVNISDYCFGGSFDLKELIIPPTVERIGKYAFFTCCNLSSLSIASSVTSIGENCFHGCHQLKELTIPSQWWNEGDRLFSIVDKSLHSLRIPFSLTLLNGQKTSIEDLTTFTIPNTVTHIRDCCFQYSRKLVSCIFNTSLRSIGNNSFEACNSLKEIRLPDSVIELGKNCFLSCRQVTFVEFSNNLQSLPYGCLKECISLKSLIIPSRIKSIGDYCFSDCLSLNSLSIPSTITSIGKSFVDRCPEEIQDIVCSLLIEYNLF